MVWLAGRTERRPPGTATAETALDCLEIPIWDFREFVKDDPDVSWKLLRHVVGMLLDARGA